MIEIYNMGPGTPEGAQPNLAEIKANDPKARERRGGRGIRPLQKPLHLVKDFVGGLKERVASRLSSKWGEGAAPADPNLPPGGEKPEVPLVVGPAPQVEPPQPPAPEQEDDRQPPPAGGEPVVTTAVESPAPAAQREQEEEEVPPPGGGERTPPPAGTDDTVPPAPKGEPLALPDKMTDAYLENTLKEAGLLYDYQSFAQRLTAATTQEEVHNAVKGFDQVIRDAYNRGDKQAYNALRDYYRQRDINIDARIEKLGIPLSGGVHPTGEAGAQPAAADRKDETVRGQTGSGIDPLEAEFLSNLSRTVKAQPAAGATTGTPPPGSGEEKTPPSAGTDTVPPAPEPRPEEPDDRRDEPERKPEEKLSLADTIYNQLPEATRKELEEKGLDTPLKGFFDKIQELGTHASEETFKEYIKSGNPAEFLLKLQGLQKSLGDFYKLAEENPLLKQVMEESFKRLGFVNEKGEPKSFEEFMKENAILEENLSDTEAAKNPELLKQLMQENKEERDRLQKLAAKGAKGELTDDDRAEAQKLVQKSLVKLKELKKKNKFLYYLTIALIIAVVANIGFNLAIPSLFPGKK